jgi:hypothetical protein
MKAKEVHRKKKLFLMGNNYIQELVISTKVVHHPIQVHGV